MKTIRNNIINEIIINKSRFICLLIRIKDTNDVINNLNKIKKDYKDATHYCYSYILDNTKRFNDDGEPNGTAGVPILNVLENNNLNNILCVVVRYFGGIKLGSGGLVRAYTKSVCEALTKTNFNLLCRGKNITITFNYENIKLIDNILKDINIKKEFNDTITYEFQINDIKLIDELKKLVNTIEIIDNIIIEKETN